MSCRSRRPYPAALRRALLAAALLALAAAPVRAPAQVVPSPGASPGSSPRVETAGSRNVPLVQIATPSGAGVSRNEYDAFNVDGRGLILNNATSVTTTQLAGMVGANPNLQGTPARVILNEVTGTGGSVLRGFTEVAGAGAEVVIANPNGITCSGCGFINASRGVLTTGAPVFGGAGSLDAFRVTGGSIAVQGAGLDGGQSRVDLISRAVAVNAGIWAGALNVVTGANEVSHQDLFAAPLAAPADRPAVSLDVGALGGMYAGKVRLVGTEKGVGVVNAGTLASSGDFTLSSAGDILLRGQTSSAGAMRVQAGGSLDNQGTLYGGTRVEVRAADTVRSASTLASGGALSVEAGSLQLGGTVGAGVTADGKVTQAGELSLTASGLVNVAGARVVSAGDLAVTGAGLNLSGATVQAGDAMQLTARTGSIAARGADLQAAGELFGSAARTFDNSGGAVLGGSVQLTAGSRISNLDGGTIRAVGDLSLQVTRGDLDNSGGTLRAGGLLSALVSGSGATATWTSAGSGAQATELQTLDGRFENAGGTAVGATVRIEADTIHNQGATGLIAATGELALLPRVLLVNERGATIFSTGDLVIDGRTDQGAGDVVNSSARIEADGALTVIAHDIVNTMAGFSARPGTERVDGELPEGSYPAHVELDPPPSGAVCPPSFTSLYGPCTHYYYMYEYSLVKPVIQTDGQAAQLLSGKDLTLSSVGGGKVENRYSVLAAGGDGTLSGSTVTQVSAPTAYVIRDYWLVGTAGSIDGPRPSIYAFSGGSGVFEAVYGENPGRPAGADPSLPAAPGSSAPTFVFTLPQNGLYHLNTDPTAKFLVESDPRYLSSDYLLGLLGIDPGQVEKRLGDGFVEQRMVLDQVTQLTGRRYLEGFAGSQEQFEALMDAGAAFALESGLKVGDPLSPAQAAAITRSMVWLVRENVGGYAVLVPRLYLAKDVTRRPATGAVIAAGGDISLTAEGGLQNTGTIDARRNLVAGTSSVTNAGRISSGGVTVLSSRGDLTVKGRGGTLSSGGGMYLSADGNLTLDGGKTAAGGDLGLTAGKALAATDARLKAGGDLVAHAAGGDLTLSTSRLEADKGVGLDAGGSIRAGGRVRTDGARGVETSSIQAGQGVQAVAGKDLSLAATSVQAGGDVLLAARDGNLTMGVVQDTRGQGLGYAGVTAGSSVSAGGRVTLEAHAADGRGSDGAGNILVEGSTISSSAVEPPRDPQQASSSAPPATVSLVADRDVTVREVHETWHAGDVLGDPSSKDPSQYRYQSDKVLGSAVSAEGGSVRIDAGRSLTLSASQVTAGTDATLVARSGDLSLLASKDIVAGESSARWADGSSHTRTYDETTRGSGITSGGSVTVAALKAGDGSGGNVRLQGSSIQGQGTVTVYGQNDVTLEEAREKHYSLEEHTKQESSLFGLIHKTTSTRDEKSSDVSAGSLVSGGAVGIAAGNDLLVKGSQVVAGGDLQLSAARDVKITASQDIQEELQQKVVKTSGLLSNGVGFAIGSRTEKNTSEVASLTNMASTVGSVEGSVLIQAGRDATIEGSGVIGKQQVDIVGQNVTIASLLDETRGRSTSEVEQSGFGVSLGGGTVQAASTAWDSAAKARDVRQTDQRLEALYALRAARNAYAAADGLVQNGFDPTAGVSLSVGFSKSGSKSETLSDATRVSGSSISSAGGIDIRATGNPDQGKGDLTIIGSAIEGKDVTLEAARDLSLLSAENVLDTRTDTSSYSWSVSLSVGLGKGGGGVGLSGSFSESEGKERGRDVVHSETTVKAGEHLTVTSGRDTTLRGAVASGDSISAKVGRNLSIESEQDSSTYHAENKTVSGSASINVIGGGGSASLNVNAGATDSTYRSVQEQSGFFAGAGGYDIDVKGKTDLVGGVIASQAGAEKNALRTATLTYSDLDNVSEYRSVSGGFSLGSGGVTPSMGMPAHDEKHGTTRAAVAAGTIVTGSDVSGLSRDTANAAGSVQNLFDKEKVARQQELAGLVGEEGFKAVGDVSKLLTDPYTKAKMVEEQGERYQALKAKPYLTDAEASELQFMEETQHMTPDLAQQYVDQGKAGMAYYQTINELFTDGGAGKILLHAAAGAAQASLGGGSALSGALGAGTSEALSRPMMDLPQSLQALGSLAIGTAAGSLGGGGALGALSGGVAAQDGEKYNRRLHQNEVDLIKRLAREKWQDAQCDGRPCRDQQEYEDRLMAAGCAMVRCSAQIREGSPEKQGAELAESYGATLEAERAALTQAAQAEYEASHLGNATDLDNITSLTGAPLLFTYSEKDEADDNYASLGLPTPTRITPRHADARYNKRASTMAKIALPTDGCEFTSEACLTPEQRKAIAESIGTTPDDEPHVLLFLEQLRTRAGVRDTHSLITPTDLNLLLAADDSRTGTYEKTAAGRAALDLKYILMDSGVDKGFYGFGINAGVGIRFGGQRPGELGEVPRPVNTDDFFIRPTPPGTRWAVYEDFDGDLRIVFQADQAVSSGVMPHKRNFTPSTLAGVTDEGQVFVYEARHRGWGAANGQSIPESRGGIPEQPGWLDYKFAPGPVPPSLERTPFNPDAIQPPSLLHVASPTLLQGEVPPPPASAPMSQVPAAPWLQQVTNQPPSRDDRSARP